MDPENWAARTSLCLDDRGFRVAKAVRSWLVFTNIRAVKLHFKEISTC